MKSCRLQAVSCQVTQKLKRATILEQPAEPAIFYDRVLQPVFYSYRIMMYNLLRNTTGATTKRLGTNSFYSFSFLFILKL